MERVSMADIRDWFLVPHAEDRGQPCCVQGTFSVPEAVRPAGIGCLRTRGCLRCSNKKGGVSDSATKYIYAFWWMCRIPLCALRQCTGDRVSIALKFAYSGVYIVYCCFHALEGSACPEARAAGAARGRYSSYRANGEQGVLLPRRGTGYMDAEHTL